MSTSPKQKSAGTTPDHTHVEVGTPHGFWASIKGSSTAVIAIIAVAGLIVLSLYVVRLAQHAIDRATQAPPAKLVVP